MQQLQLALFQKIIIFLDRYYLKVDVNLGLIREWVSLVDKRLTTRGPVDTVAWIKLIRLASTRYLCGSPLSPSECPGVELDEGGLPKIAVAQLLRDRQPNHVRLGLTLLNVSRIVKGTKTADLSTITEPGKDFDSSIGASFAATVKRLGWRLPRPAWEGWHVTTKAGPNAQALLGAIEDVSLLSDDNIRDIGILGGEDIVRAIGTLQLFSPLAWLSKFGLSPKGRRSKLARIKDKETKCRIVGILDYPTQSALYPLHNALMGLLKRLKPDCTFNQGSFRATLPLKGPYYSYDLSAATDRFPCKLQEIVLSQLIDAEYAAAWLRATTDRDFAVTWIRPAENIRYSVGQPMGAYSSWALFAVSHHVAVRLAAERAGFPDFQAYALLGDDIVITNSEVAREYRTLLKEIGVSISDTKSHVSLDTYEFAKRWIHRGTEVSPAPLGSLFEAMRLDKKWTGGFSHPEKGVLFISYYEVATWFRELEARWTPRSYTVVTRGLVASLLKLLLKSTAYADRLAEKAFKFFLLPSREDNKNLRREKARILLSLISGNIFSCNLAGSYRGTFPSVIDREGDEVKFPELNLAPERRLQADEWLMIWLNECKARVLEEAIKKQLASLQRFQLELGKYVDLLPEGLDAQSTLLSLPPLAVIVRSISQLQQEFDKAHKVRDSTDPQHWLELEVRLFLDPFATLSTRKSKTIASSKATVLNHVTAMLRGIDRVRALAVSSIDLKSLMHDMQNHVVVPTRGDRRKRRSTGKGPGMS